MLRMELQIPSYYSLSWKTTGITGGPSHPNSDTFHDLSILMSVRWAGEMPLPPKVFAKEHIHGICHLHAHTLPLAVSILNWYEFLLEFASDSDVSQIAQDLEKVACWLEVPITMACTTSSDENQLECISRERQEY